MCIENENYHRCRKILRNALSISRLEHYAGHSTFLLTWFYNGSYMFLWNIALLQQYEPKENVSLN
jgi:hypothetical protein